MTRAPLAIADGENTMGGATTTVNTLQSMPQAWICIVFASFFLISALAHGALLLKYKATFIWTIVSAALLECLTLIEFACSAAYNLSPYWLVAGTVLHWLAPTVLQIACIQIFGRAAWQGILTNPRQLTRLHGFARCNTMIFGALSVGAWLLLFVGSMVVVASAPDGQVIPANTSAVLAAYGVMKAGLILQMVVILVFIAIVWRFKRVSNDWDVEWDEQRQFTWTWKKLVTIVLVSAELLSIRQLYYIIIFFLHYTSLRWLSLIFDAGPVLGVIVAFAVLHPGRCLDRKLTKLRLNKDRLLGVRPERVAAPSVISSSEQSEFTKA